MLAPGRADLHSLAALPSTRAIETRSLPTSLAATHRGFAFYVALPKSSIPSIATCSMSLIPLTLSLPLSRPLGFAHLCRGFPARSDPSIREQAAAATARARWL